VIAFRRRLPHVYGDSQPIFVTFCLHGSMPTNRKFPEATTGKAFVAMDRLLESARSGPFYLGQPKIGEMVVDAIRYRDGLQYKLHSYVVMPNHVHLLITPLVNLSKVMQSLKRFTGLEGNRILGLTGPFWQHESYDHLVRNETEFRRISRYIENNPVKAGLVAAPEEFSWCSAGPIDNRPPVGNWPTSDSI
jgi:REP element-mobilizing transposase RayT